MTIEENKRLVTTTMLYILNQRLDEAAPLLAEDIDWLFPSDGGRRSQVRGRDNALTHSALLKTFFPAGLDVTIDRLTGEEDRVVVEYHYRGFTADGSAYENHYCSVFTVKDGQVTSVSEHTDTGYAARMLGGLARSAGLFHD